MSAKPHEVETLADGREPPPVEPVLGGLFAGRFHMERCIGRGSMGTVYAALDHAVEERIALKLLMTPSEQALERFRREVRLARKVTHRNAARTFDLGEHGGARFITMELVDGESLRQRLTRDGRADPAEVVEIARQVSLGLQAAHEVGVIHRDLKPANVLVEPSGRAVITDFGVACSIDGEPEALPIETLERAPMTGTPAYMAPEQVLGIPQDPRADLYALGAMLYELLTGTTPWPGANNVEIAMARLHRAPPDPRARVAVPDGLAELVLACMGRAPEHRPTGAAEVVARLEVLRRGATAVEVPARPGDDGSSRGSSSGGVAFVPTTVGERALAVLPLRYHGPPEDAYLAEALGDELIDLLAMTRGLRVSASGATARFRDERDARTVGRALGVHAVVDGTVQRSGSELRIVARLVDVDTGFQRWSERFAGRLEDVFALQDRMAKRVAEALRVELVLAEHGAGASPEAVEHYLRGRVLARDNELTGAALEAVIDRFERARAAAPGFALPLAAQAEATVRRWFLAAQAEGERWAEASRRAVEDALRGAPGLAETQLAAARYELNRGDFRAAALHLDAALEIAPTYAAAHEYLGMLQCDAGRSREGAQHILLAHELDPTLGVGGLAVLRHYALRGEDEAFERQLRRLRELPSVPRFTTDLFELRRWLWRGELEAARAMRWPSNDVSPVLAVGEPIRMALDDRVPVEALAEQLELAHARTASPRLRTTWRQISVELLALRGANALALAALATADAEHTLVDADWVERCPLFRPLYDEPTFVEVRARVRERANRIWRAAPGRV
jgi:eukaryotic-like serine/threonine-protein kinase